MYIDIFTVWLAIREFLLNLIKIVMKEALFDLVHVRNGLDETAPFLEGQRRATRSSQVPQPKASVGPRRVRDLGRSAVGPGEMAQRF